MQGDGKLCTIKERSWLIQSLYLLTMRGEGKVGVSHGMNFGFPPVEILSFPLPAVNSDCKYKVKTMGWIEDGSYARSVKIRGL